jgi:hypothetical protein
VKLPITGKFAANATPCNTRNAIKQLKLPIRIAIGIIQVANADSIPKTGKTIRIPKRVTSETTGSVDMRVLIATVDVSRVF